jgi:beta-N-acetylhexosaminidase
VTTQQDRWIDDLMGRMNLDQKIGQLLVFGFCGPVITPDVIEMLQKYQIGGLRISQKFRAMTLFNDVKPGTQPCEQILRSMHTPTGKNRDYAYIHSPVGCSAQEYARSLNQLRDYAMDRPLGIPIHLTIDQEGSASDDLLSDQRLFPHPMGYAAAQDPDLAYRAALCIGKQARAIGANMIHSPVLDVNTNPRNPEIGTRAFSNDPRIVTEYALAMMRGFRETGLAATGKHFPGRGHSSTDAHWSLPSVDLDEDTLRKVHIWPYKQLIAAGLDAVMIAQSSYPALGTGDIPAAVCSRIVTDLLRGEIGFEGVITTDNMMMGGVLEKYEMSEAIIQCLQAGCDLILTRDETPLRLKIIQSLHDAVKDGRLTESRIDESVQRILRMRWNMGLADNGGKVDAEKAGQPFHDPVVMATAVEAAEKTVLRLRDQQSLMPLKTGQRVLLVEQIFPTHSFANNMYSHPGLLWEQMCQFSDNVASVEIPYVPTAKDVERVMRRVHEAEVLVMTNYYYHKAASSITDLVRQVRKRSKPVVVVTSTPYQFGAPEDFPTVIVCFNPGGPENLRAVAKVLYGKLEPTASLSIVVEKAEKDEDVTCFTQPVEL